MTDGTILAHLMEDAHAAGTELVTLKAMAEEAAESGAQRAMAAIGLADEAAHKDVAELRQLLAAWRDAKSSMRRAVIEWLVRIGLATLLLVLAVRHGLIAELLR
ncbi:MAG: hypothetical protein KGQ42_04145 [Alphaproteobacteria bacterium]|nr:hypothetical protein [Alphaproteobacteria bacterium]MDE2339921.1 hypothetical protein [Alphaproteobacteria bacterium]